MIGSLIMIIFYICSGLPTCMVFGLSVDPSHGGIYSLCYNIGWTTYLIFGILCILTFSSKIKNLL
jgi:hypothetical protein